MLSLQASYAAPLILLAQNRQEHRDKVIAEQDRQANARAHADMEFLAREVASLRMAVGEVATRDYLRSELRALLIELEERSTTPTQSRRSRDQSQARPRRPPAVEAALVVVLLVTALSLVVQPELPIVGAGAAESPGRRTTPREIVSADGVRTGASRSCRHRLPSGERPTRNRDDLLRPTVGRHAERAHVQHPLRSGTEQRPRPRADRPRDRVLGRRRRPDAGDRQVPPPQPLASTSPRGSRTGSAWSTSYGLNESPGNGQIGNATLSRFPIVDQTNTHLPHQPGLAGRAAAGRAAHRHRRRRSTVVSVFNTHLQDRVR